MTFEKRVLIVDDEAGVRRSLCGQLAECGYQHDDVTDGLTALEHIHQSFREVNPYSHVLANVALPDIDGLKLLDVIKARFPGLPVVMTGYGDGPTVPHKADGYVERPVEIGALVALLDRLARRPSAGAKPVVHEVPATVYALLRLPAGGAARPAREVRPLACVFRRFYGREHVVYCDAVRGGYDLVMLLGGHGADDLEQIRQETMALVKTCCGGRVEDQPQLDFLPIHTPALPLGIAEFMADYRRALLCEQSVDRVQADRLLAYVLCEISREQQAAAYATFWFKDCVVGCDATRGEYDIVLVIEAGSYRELEAIVHRHVRPVRGVLRARLVPIIDLFQM